MAVAWDDILPRLGSNALAQVQKSVSAYDIALRVLYAYVPFKGKLKPEERLCAKIHEQLCRYKFEGKLKGQWCHIPNEGNRSRLAKAILKAIGLISGAGDYVHVWENGGGWIEVKTTDGKVSEKQKYFEIVCKQDRSNHAIVYSAQAYFDVLERWGALVFK